MTRVTTHSSIGRILYVQYTNPGGYPPLEHGAHLLADAGFDVLMLGLDNHGGALQLKPHPRIRVVLEPFQSEGWRQKLHYARFALTAAVWTARFRPGWIYASDPLSCPIALLLRLFGTRVIYHEHDSPSPATEPGESRFSRVVRRARAAVAKRADLCILPNARRADVFRETTGRAATTTVWNTPLIEEAAAAMPRVQADPARLRVLYHGSIVPSRLPLAVVDAIARLPGGISLSIAGYETVGHPGYVQELVNRATALGISDRVHVAGLLATRQELLQHCGTCAVGLALMPAGSADINSREMVGASNKPFDYMACGLALLVSDLADWRATFVEPGFARACDPASVDSLEQNLRWFLEHPADTARMGERGREQIRRAWNYEASFAPVLAHMRPPALEAPLRAALAGPPAVRTAGPARPFFSVCIPQYNRTSFLIEACRTLETQTFRDFEVCISDDCSNDGREADLLAYLASSGLVFTYRRRDQNGRYDANLRSALGLAKGRYCFLLGNDDGLKGPETLGQVHDLLIQAPQAGVVFTHFEDFTTGRVVRKGRVTRLLGSGPDVAASVFRRFSFVSGLVLETARVEAEATSKWDGSEMYQMYLGCRMIASGAFVLEADLVTIRKDIQVSGELVDSYAHKPQPKTSGIPAQPIPLVQHARLVADAIGPYATGGRTGVFVNVSLQFLGLLYPYWLLEYRRVRSWRFAAGVARAMRPAHTLADIRLSWMARGLSMVLYGVATVVGLAAPVGVLTVLHAPARRVARLIEEWSA